MLIHRPFENQTRLEITGPEIAQFWYSNVRFSHVHCILTMGICGAWPLTPLNDTLIHLKCKYINHTKSSPIIQVILKSSSFYDRYDYESIYVCTHLGLKWVRELLLGLTGTYTA
jgi:hypothetical protein